MGTFYDITMIITLIIIVLAIVITVVYFTCIKDKEDKK